MRQRDVARGRARRTRARRRAGRAGLPCAWASRDAEGWDEGRRTE